MSEYDEQLKAWKAKNGFVDVDETNPDEVRMAAQEQASKKKAWCFECDKHMPVREMRLITRKIDPYTQTDEGPTDYIAESNRVRMCPECFKERYEDQ